METPGREGGQISRPSKEVYARYHAKAYVKYSIAFRRDTDKDIIEYIETNKAKGISPTGTIRELFKTK